MRLPYKEQVVDQVSIRYGRSDRDNDELSCNPEHRDDDFWWLHVEHDPGCHVVICTTDDNLIHDLNNRVLTTALRLAVNNSKANPSMQRVPVIVTRCWNVTKLKYAVPGSVVMIDQSHVQVVMYQR